MNSTFTTPSERVLRALDSLHALDAWKTIREEWLEPALQKQLELNSGIGDKTMDVVDGNKMLAGQGIAQAIKLVLVTQDNAHELLKVVTQRKSIKAGLRTMNTA